MRTLARTATAALLFASLATLGASPRANAEDTPAASTDPVPAGDYTLDKAHASLIFRVNHVGFSNYTARFLRFDAQLRFDPQNLAASSVTATIDPASIETDYPEPEKLDFNRELAGSAWLDAAQFPVILFKSTKVEPLGNGAMRIHGELSLHGVTQPLVLEATWNGGYAGHPFDPRARIGFSARGALLRSNFGVAYGIPAPGTKMGVSDAVEVIIEAEFSGPAWANAPPPPAPVLEPTPAPQPPP